MIPAHVAWLLDANLLQHYKGDSKSSYGYGKDGYKKYDDKDHK